MKFKVLKSTSLHEQIEAIMKKIETADNAARDLVKELGFKKFYKKSMKLAGGFYGLIPLDGKA